MNFNTIAHYRTFIKLLKITLIIFGFFMLYEAIKFFIKQEIHESQIISEGEEKLDYSYDSYVENPEFHGIDEKGNKYNIASKLGFQKAKNLFELQNIIAFCSLTNGSKIEFAGDRAELNLSSSLINANGNIKMNYDQTNRIISNQGDLNYKQAIAELQGSVHFDSEKINIKADKLLLDENYQHMVFSSKNKVITQIKANVEK